MAAPIVISILANANQANATLNKTSGLMGKVGRAGRVMAAGAGLGLLALGAAAKDFVGEAREAQKVTANTKAVIKATGGAAGISAKHVDSLATSLSNKTGIDDEAVASGANLLLTFKNIKKTGGIFDRATTSALDLSAAGFGSVESASKTLGKALNDPIKGVSALSKQGVTFTQVQKDQIAGFVKSGQAAKAQALILKEVESQVGGQAAAQATAGDKLAVTVGNIKEEIGAKLLPILDRVATYLVVKLPGWMATAGAAFTTLKGYVVPIVETVRSFFGSLDSGTGTTSAKFAQFQATAATVFASIKSIISSTVSIVTSLWAKFGADLTRYAATSLTNVMTVLRGAFSVISGIFKTVAALLKGDWRGAWEGIKQIVKGALTVVRGVVSQGVNVIRTTFSVGIKTLTGIVSSVFNGLKSAAGAGVRRLVDYVGTLPGKITGAIPNPLGILSSIGGQIVDGLTAGIRGAADRVAGAVDAIVGKIPKAIREKMGIASPSKVTTILGRFIAQGLAQGMFEGVGDVRSSVLNLAKVVNEDLPKKIKKPKAIRAWYRQHKKDVLEGTRDVVQSMKASAKARLDALKAQRDEYAASVAQAARDYAALGNLVLGENENLSAAGIKQYFTDRLSAINNFTAKLASLKGRITSSLYDQIAKMGVEQGTAYAEALSTASPEALAQINSLAGQIDSGAVALGNTTAATMYASGVQSAQGFYDGLQSMLKKIEKQGVKIAKALVKELRKALDINSPSRVMKGIGKYSVEGLDDGLDPRRIQDKGRALAKSLVKGYANPTLDAQLTAGFRASDLSASTSKGDTYNTFNVTVRLDNSMTREQMGVEYTKAIDAAKRVGLVTG